MELTGTVKKIFETKTFDSGFQKREMVITTQENYPQDILLEFLQDKTSLLDAVNEGENVKVSINIRGREWVNPEGQAKYFNSITGWRLEKIQPNNMANPQDMSPQVEPATNSFPQEAQNNIDEEDDLPF